MQETPTNPVTNLLNQWPSMQTVYEDALAADPDLKRIAVYRWFKRGSVPPRFWEALLEGAARRKVTVTAKDFIAAHAERAA
jgi:hypothetical protein